MSSPPLEQTAVTMTGVPGFDVARSARVLGTLHVGPGALVAQGAVVRSLGASARLGGHSAILENSVLVSTPEFPATVGEKALFGHRCLIIGARVGALCEVGNASILMPGATLGERCFLGEGTLIPAGMAVPSDSVVVGRPGQIIRRVSPQDLARLKALRDGDLSLSAPPLSSISVLDRAEDAPMGQLYAFRDKQPVVHPTATLFSSAEVTGDVVIGEGSIIGAGVKIIGDSHGPVRIGARVQILENTVLHLLPDNTLVLEDDVIIGPGAMIHGCHIGAGSVVEPGAIVCDSSRLGRNCLVTAGTLVRQRATYPDGAILEGFPATQVGTMSTPQQRPGWALRPEDLPTLRRLG